MVDLIETLLYEEESNTLDFKREQYRFVGANDDEKSKLLKDILAFANAFRRETAYILLGIEEVKGGRSKPVGIGANAHIDDASLQQFVNSKTNRVVKFAYHAATIDNLPVAVIEIPVQERPVYLAKDYGTLSAETVYLRHGSSGEEASIDEIAAMGREGIGRRQIPALDLQFADVMNQENLSRSLYLDSVQIVLPPSSQIPTLSAGTSVLPSIRIPDPSVNTRYYKEFAAFLADRALYNKIGLSICNAGSLPLTNVRAEIEVRRSLGLRLTDEGPRQPSSDIYGSLRPIDFNHPKSTLEVHEYRDRFAVISQHERIQPKRTVFSDTLYVGALRSGRATLQALVYADEIDEPKTFEMNLEFISHSKSLTVDDVVRIADQYK